MTDLPPLASLLDHVGEAVVLLRVSDEARALARIVAVNRPFTRLTGLDPDRIVGRSLRALRSPGHRQDFARLQAAMIAGEPFDGRLDLAAGDGAAVPVTVRGLPLPRDDCHYMLLMERMPADAGVRKMQDMVELAGSLASACLYVLRVGADCRLELEWADASIERLTGYGLDALRAAGGLTAFVADEDLDALARRNLDILAGRQASVDYRLRHHDGTPRWLRDVARPELQEPGGRITRVIGSLVDVGHEHRPAEVGRSLEILVGELASGLQAVVAVVDGSGRMHGAAAAGESSLGGALLGAIGEELEAALGPPAADLWVDGIERCLALRERVTFGFTWTQGEQPAELDVVISPIDDDLALMLARPRGRGGLPPSAAEPGLPLGVGTVQLLDALEGVSLILSPEFRLMAAGTAVERLVGAKPGELHGQAFADLLVPGIDTARLDAALAAVARGERAGTIDAPLRGRGNHASPLRWRFAPLVDSGGQGAAILARGAAPPRRAADDRARRGEPWLGAILDSVADGIVSIAGDGTVESFSRSAEQIFEYGRSEVQGRHIELLLTAGPAAELNVLKLLSEGLSDDRPPQELFARRRSGEIIPVEIAVTPLDYDGQRVFILTIRDITVRKQTEETLRNLAYLDPLTGLPNRLLFHDRLVQSIERARRSRQLLAVLLVDLDRFKLINDSLGLEKGDLVLRAVAERLGRALRRSDTVARLGGDEFMLLVASAANAEAVAKVAQKIQDTLRPPFAVNGHELTTGASIGIALFPHDGDDADTLIKNADTALSRAKEQGRAHFQFYTNDMNATAFERLMLESRLRKALEQGEMAVYYQPQLNIGTGRVVGVEALVRWFHPDLGMVPPADFIPLAEETGLIVPIGEWVLRTACRDGRLWQEQGFQPLRVAVNLSARQFQQRDLADVVARVLEETALPATDLELELTESVIMRDAAESVRRLRELTALGIQLAVDDFGTGYSSLGYLRTFPIRSLKIDRSFIRDIDRDPNGAAIAQAIIALASSLSLKAIAEGVETREQLDMLRGWGCEEMQGYLFSRPLPADELTALLRQGRRLPT